jgi:hypothetical protein
MRGIARARDSSLQDQKEDLEKVNARRWHFLLPSPPSPGFG